MRFRSPQFVFLLLLICAVQNRDAYTLHVVADAVSGRSSSRSELRAVESVALDRKSNASPRTALPPPETGLDAASLASHSTPWPMRRPALQSSAVSSFTSFLRA